MFTEHKPCHGGVYIPVETQDELASAFEKTLCCPMISQRDGDQSGN
jgi:hypothetical protein